VRGPAHRSIGRHLDLRGSRLHYRIAGRGPAILLLHGWALDGRLWTPLLAHLAQRHRVITVDRRGFGRSTGSVSLDREAQDLRVLFLRLGLTRAAVLGMSQGARVALRLAQGRTPALRALILDGPPAPPRRPGDPGHEDPPLARYRSLLAAEGVNAFRREWRAHPLLTLRRPRTSSRWLLARMLARYRAQDLRAAPRADGARRRVDPRTIRTPTLVLVGGKDQPARLAAATALRAQLPRAQLARVAGAGHLPNLDQPRAYARALEAFLRRHGPVPGR